MIALLLLKMIIIIRNTRVALLRHIQVKSHCVPYSEKGVERGRGGPLKRRRIVLDVKEATIL